MTRLHIMLDLETMGTKHCPPILQIAAVTFDPISPIGIISKFNAYISLANNIRAGLLPEPETMEWWNKQSSEAKQQVLEASNRSQLSLFDACYSFKNWIEDVKNENNADYLGVWGNGSLFDIRIMNDVFGKLNIPIPWKYNEDRDMRTIVDIANTLTGFDHKSVPFEGTAHNAVDDCQHQIKIVQECYKRLSAINK